MTNRCRLRSRYNSGVGLFRINLSFLPISMGSNPRLMWNLHPLIHCLLLQLNVIWETKTVVIYRDKEALTVESVVGSLGGTLNLWVGVSFITLIELIDLAYQLLKSCAQKQDQETTKVMPFNPESTNNSDVFLV